MTTLADHLRKLTRNGTSPLPEEPVLALARDLLRELARAHAEGRHPDIDPDAISMTETVPSLAGGTPSGSAVEDLFHLGALVNSLALGSPADVGWRLDGPPSVPAASLARRAALEALGSPRPDRRFETADAALRAFEFALQPLDQPRSAWPIFRGDPGRSGVTAAAAPISGLTTLWSAPIGAVSASPVLRDQHVIVATADGRLVFLDRENGRIVHELKIASAIESSPAILGRRAYVGTDDGTLVAVDVVDGTPAFRATLGQLVRSSPLPFEDLLIVGVVESKSAGFLVALDAQKGKPAWKRKLGGAVFSSPALLKDRVVVGSDDGGVQALDPKKGEPVWTSALTGKVRATPVGGGDAVIAADFAGRIAALGAADGKPVWLRETGVPIYSTPVVAGGVVVAANNQGGIRGCDTATGEIRFELDTRGPVISSPVAVGDRFVLGCTDGALYLFDAKGALVVRMPVGSGGIQSTPAVADGVLFVGTADGVSALRLTT